MLGGFIAGIRLIWPFLKESILEGGTVRDWIRRNRSICFLIVMMLANLAITLYFADLLIASQRRTNQAVAEVATAKGNLRDLTTRYNGLVVKYNYQLGQTKLERNRVVRLRMLIADSCPVDSNAYRTLVAGVESLDTPALAQDVSVEWCKVVTPKDLQNPGIRERFLTECGKPRP